jgi:hypothetical protein
MTALSWWMRVVGALYLFMCLAAIVLKLPIRVEGPKGVLAQASAGDPTARFVVDIWVMLGLYFLVIGTALLIASRVPAQARVLVWTVIGFELAGIVVDIYKIARGYVRTAPVVWMMIHSMIIVTGLILLRTG